MIFAYVALQKQKTLSTGMYTMNKLETRSFLYFLVILVYSVQWTNAGGFTDYLTELFTKDNFYGSTSGTGHRQVMAEGEAAEREFENTYTANIEDNRPEKYIEVLQEKIRILEDRLNHRRCSWWNCWLIQWVLNRQRKRLGRALSRKRQSK